MRVKVTSPPPRVQVLCQGVDQGYWGQTAVAHTLEKAQSPDFIAKVRLWEGKDDKRNFAAHVTMLLKQIFNLEAGYDVTDMLMPRAPLEILRGAEECGADAIEAKVLKAQQAVQNAGRRVAKKAHANLDAALAEKRSITVAGKEAKQDVQSLKSSRRPGHWGESRQATDDLRHDGLGASTCAHLHVRDLRGPTGGKTELGQLGRLALVHAVRMFPSLLVCLDGGTWASASGVSVSNKEKNDFLTNLTRQEQRRPYRWVWLEEGDHVMGWCNRVRKGDEAFLAVTLMGLEREHNAAMANLTQEKERKYCGGGSGGGEDECDEDDKDDDDMPTAGGIFMPAPEQEEATAAELATAAAATNAASGANLGKPFEDDDLNPPKMNPPFNHETYLSGVYSDAVREESLRGGKLGPRRPRYGIELPLRMRTLVRLPAIPEKAGSRALPDAAWGDLDVVSKCALCILHAAMRTVESIFKRLIAPLEEEFCKGGRVKTAVELHLNKQLGALGCRKLACNPETKKSYKASFDGKPAMSWVDDVHRGLVEHAPNLHAEWGLVNCRSRFVRGLACTYQKLGNNYAGHYAGLKEAVPMLRDYVIAMKSAMKMKPTARDYELVDEHMPRYVVGKLLLWEGSNTWYDNHCLFAIPHMMRKWGSLRLVSQEGMEGWQKKLNDILRLNNGWANAGAIPKAVHTMGQAAVDAYMSARADDKPSSARWVYEQALLQQHAQWVPVLKERDALKGDEDREMDWARFVELWQRYLAFATLYVWSLARVRVREARWRAMEEGAPMLRDARGRETHVPHTYYTELLASHRHYWRRISTPELSAPDLSAREQACQRRKMRRERYAKSHGPKGEALAAMHPYLTNADFMEQSEEEDMEPAWTEWDDDDRAEWEDNDWRSDDMDDL